MKAFNQLTHDHIIRGVSAVKQSEKYFIILEWANGGTLRNFWKDNPKPILSREVISEFLDQLHGITEALYEIHEFTKVSYERRKTRSFRSSTSSEERPEGYDQFKSIIGDEQVIAEPDEIATNDLPPQLNLPSNPPRNDFERPPPTMELPAETTLPEVPKVNIVRPASSAGEASVTEESDEMSRAGDNWRLGDVKPENILRFENNRWLGRLKLADFGRAKKHNIATQLRKVGTDERYGTRKYEPPEAITHSQGGKRSRKYDVWSMGCVIFESLYWLLYGIQEQDNHDAATKFSNLNGLDTAYWTLTSANPPTAKVNEITAKAIEHMLSSDPECNQESGTALGDLLTLVKEKLLVVRLPERDDTPEQRSKSRTTAEVLQLELGKIIQRTKTDEKYLFTGIPRDDVTPPPLAKPSQVTSLVVGSPGGAPDGLSPSQPPRELAIPQFVENVRIQGKFFGQLLTFNLLLMTVKDLCK
jgi:serine/threonine protein kinase